VNGTPSLLNFDPILIDPERLKLVLQESGWKIAGQRANIYVRLLPPEEEKQTVLVPLDRQAPEYIEAMRAALAHIAHFVTRDSWMSNVSARLITEPADSFRFRAESAAPSGLISWNHGERLITSSRRILAAGAKTNIEHLKYFGNRYGRFANRYLDSVLMGQTAPGSYIVTAFTPVNGSIQVSSAREDSESMFPVATESVSTRSIGISMMTAAMATKEAVDHYRSRASLAGFEDLVSLGISYEMTTALSDLVRESDGADITVEWDPVLEAPGKVLPDQIEFLPSDAEVLTKASVQLAASAQPATEITVMGRVHLLTQREAGGPGVIGIENLSTSKPKRLRVHLNDEDYHAALRAHDRNDAIVVQGQVEREGNLHWIYNGRLITVLGPVSDISSEAAKAPWDNIPGQLAFDEDDQDG
jgi:hypothetical protein